MGSDAGVSVGEGSVEERWISLSIGLSLTLVDLAHGGDGEGGGDGLVRSGTGSIPVGSVVVGVGGISIASIGIGSNSGISGGVEERWVSLSFSFTLSKVVSSVSVVVGVAVVTIAIGSITSIGVGSISTIGVGSGSVTGIEKSWVGLSFGFSSDSCNTGKSYDLETKR